MSVNATDRLEAAAQMETHDMLAYQPSGPDEERFLAGYDPSGFPAFGVTVDLVMLTIRQSALHLLLINRGDFPYKGRWALPGGFVNVDEDLEEAALRELAEETGLKHRVGHLEQLATYGAVGRDPRMRVIDIAYLALLPDLPDPKAGSDAAQAQWWRVDEITEDMLAFDHAQILAAGLERARAKLEYTPLATAFCGQHFTLRELQNVYEAVWDTELDRRNFRRKVLSTPGFVTPLKDKTPTGSTGGGRRSTLYRPDGASLLHPALLRPSESADGAPRHDLDEQS